MHCMPPITGHSHCAATSKSCVCVCVCVYITHFYKHHLTCTEQATSTQQDGCPGKSRITQILFGSFRNFQNDASVRPLDLYFASCDLEL